MTRNYINLKKIQIDFYRWRIRDRYILTDPKYKVIPWSVIISAPILQQCIALTKIALFLDLPIQLS